MKERSISLPTVGLIAGTRVALGVGLGLLLAGRLTSQQRQACGWALACVGALTTIPLALQVLSANEVADEQESGTTGNSRRRAHNRLPSDA